MSLYIGDDLGVGKLQEVFGPIDSARSATLRRGERQHFCQPFDGPEFAVPLIVPAGAPPLAWRASVGLTLVHRDGGPGADGTFPADGTGFYLWRWTDRRLRRIASSPAIFGSCVLLGAHIGPDGTAWLALRTACATTDVLQIVLVVIRDDDDSAALVPEVVTTLATTDAPFGIAGRTHGVATFLDGPGELIVAVGATRTFAGCAVRLPTPPLKATPAALRVNGQPIRRLRGWIDDRVALEVGRRENAALALVGRNEIDIVSRPGAAGLDVAGRFFLIGSSVVFAGVEGVWVRMPEGWATAMGPGCGILQGEDGALTRPPGSAEGGEETARELPLTRPPGSAEGGEETAREPLTRPPGSAEETAFDVVCSAGQAALVVSRAGGARLAHSGTAP